MVEEGVHPEHVQKKYKKLVESARELEQPKYLDKEGNKVKPDKAYGQPVTIKITHPEWILFADETGCNTNMKKDANYGGSKYIVPCGTCPKKHAATSDHCFTLFPMICATGANVINVFIFNSNFPEVKASWNSGFDIMAAIKTNESGQPVIDKDNCRPGSFYPRGMTTHFQGKEIPMLTFYSPGGSMTANILKSIFEYLDMIGVYQRSPKGPRLVVILDGHNTQLSYTFLEYMSRPELYWCVNLGAPYLTHLWQLGDSAKITTSPQSADAS